MVDIEEAIGSAVLEKSNIQQVPVDPIRSVGIDMGRVMVVVRRGHRLWATGTGEGGEQVMTAEVGAVRAHVDTTFDFRTDARGADPDLTSPTLRRYHQALWSRPLPGGAMFTLDDAFPGSYLHHGSRLGEFFLSSDTIMPTFAMRASSKPILGRVAEAEHEALKPRDTPIGGMIVFPSNKIVGKLTINGARF